MMISKKLSFYALVNVLVLNHFTMHAMFSPQKSSDKQLERSAELSIQFTSLLKAIEASNLPIARQIVADYPAVLTAQDERGWTALMHAVEQSCSDAKGALFLIEADRLHATINLKNEAGETALIIAARSHADETVLSLLVKLVGRKHIDDEDLSGATALTKAAESSGLPSMSEVLAQAGVSTDTIQSLTQGTSSRVIAQALLNAGAAIGKREKTSGLSAIDYAVTHGNLTLVQTLLTHGAKVPAITELPTTADFMRRLPEWEAIKERMLACLLLFDFAETSDATVIGEVKKLLDQYPEILNARDQHGNTALMLAVQQNHEILSKFLLEKGAHRLLNNDDGNTALMIAIDKQYHQLVILLAEKDAQEIDRLLLKPAQDGDMARVAHLIEQGLPVDSRGSGGKTALIVAAENGTYEAVKRLIALNANVNARDEVNQTALQLAAKNGHADVVTYLLRHHAAVNAQDAHGYTALMWAIANKPEHVDTSKTAAYIAIAKELIVEAATNLDLPNINGMTPLMFAAAMGNLEILRLLVRRNVLVNLKDHDRKTALMHAAQNGRTAIVHCLIIEGRAQLKLRDKEHKTAYELAIKAADELAHTDPGNAVTIKTYADTIMCFNTALHEAARSGDCDLIRQLIAQGVDINAHDGDGKEAFMVAAQYNKIAAMKLLLELGYEKIVRKRYTLANKV